MGYFTYLTDAVNQVPSATLTPSTEDGFYLVENVAALPIAKTFRFTGILDENLLIDLGSAMSISMLAIVNHNFSSTATITLSAGTTVAASDFSTSVPWREFDAWKYLSSPETYRYWKVRIQDPSNSESFLEIGYLMLGLGVALDTFNFSYGWVTEDRYRNLENRTELGVPYVTELYSEIVLRFLFEEVSRTEGDSLRTLFNSLKRNVNPLFLVPDWERTDGYFGRIIENFPRTLGRYERSSVPLTFQTDSRGESIAS